MKQVILKSYKLVSVDRNHSTLCLKNEGRVRVVRLSFKELWVSPASNLFIKVYHIDIPETKLDMNMLDSLAEKDAPTFKGFVANGQLTLLEHVGKPQPVNLDEFEVLIRANLAK